MKASDDRERRRVGQPDDIGDAVAMLLAPESGWINGQRIEVSGGMELRRSTAADAQRRTGGIS